MPTIARNKHPEKTKKLIVEKAFELFKQKGYEYVVMQDIINATGLSRGAVYHHFANKNDIMNEVLAVQYNNDIAFYNTIMQKELSATQRIDEIINFVVTNEKNKEVPYGLWVQNNPVVLFSNMQNTILESAPAIAEIVKQGIKEGVCTTKYPLEAAEIIMLLLNIWLDPSMFGRTLEQYNQKMSFLLDTLQRIGVPLISESSAEKLKNFYHNYFFELQKEP